MTKQEVAKLKAMGLTDETIAGITAKAPKAPRVQRAVAGSFQRVSYRKPTGIAFDPALSGKSANKRVADLDALGIRRNAFKQCAARMTAFDPSLTVLETNRRLHAAVERGEAFGHVSSAQLDAWLNTPAIKTPPPAKVTVAPALDPALIAAVANAVLEALTAPTK